MGRHICGPDVVVVKIWDKLYLGRAPRIKETLLDFHVWCRVTRHPRLFHRLTGVQRDPRVWGVTAWYQSLGTRVPRAWGTWA